MKKLSLVFIICLSLALAACGNTAKQEVKQKETHTEVKENKESSSDTEKKEIIKEEAAYSGQIDGNSIEVITDSETMALQLGEVEGIDWSSIEEKAPVIISYYKNNKGQNILTKFEITHSQENNIEKSSQDAAAKKAKVIRTEGIYTGRIDGNSVEINTGNETLGLQDGMVKDFNWDGIPDNSPVIIEYFINNEEQYVLTYIEMKMEKQEDIIKAEGAYAGKIDDITIHVNTEMETLPLQIGNVKNVDWESIPENGRVIVSYYKNENGQNMLTSIDVK
ncbi:hypothetical protein CVD28_05160 [Bacillus sp. M6-12]|uniref:hypothetical protein n=1 Tax=Bacillus sp. M6-12 TaxID=2054166 RepID=UPI000C779836|nr:hypothetical protein [Bacillus sp. M6-12]PLS18530.1 hypothetical protein CVD28_05160 [Bacillus sp. M6-12]